MKHRSSGFTVIELIATLAILSVLALAALPLSELVNKRLKEQELRRALWEIRGAIDAYKKAAEEGRIRIDATGSGYPPNLSVLADGLTVVSGRNSGTTIYFLRRVPRDPFFEDTRVPAEQTWGLRSYASPSSDPKPGVDVFDVYSRSKDVGLNRIPYRHW
jgi:general secretion pathway protein G